MTALVPLVPANILVYQRMLVLLRIMSKFSRFKNQFPITIGTISPKVLTSIKILLRKTAVDAPQWENKNFTLLNIFHMCT